MTFIECTAFCLVVYPLSNLWGGIGRFAISSCLKTRHSSLSVSLVLLVLYLCLLVSSLPISHLCCSLSFPPISSLPHDLSLPHHSLSSKEGQYPSFFLPVTLLSLYLVYLACRPDLWPRDFLPCLSLNIALFLFPPLSPPPASSSSFHFLVCTSFFPLDRVCCLFHLLSIFRPFWVFCLLVVLCFRSPLNLLIFT